MWISSPRTELYQPIIINIINYLSRPLVQVLPHIAGLFFPTKPQFSIVRYQQQDQSCQENLPVCLKTVFLLVGAGPAVTLTGTIHNTRKNQSMVGIFFGTIEMPRRGPPFICILERRAALRPGRGPREGVEYFYALRLFKLGSYMSSSISNVKSGSWQ